MSATNQTSAARPTLEPRQGWWRFLALNLAVYLAVAVAGAVLGSVVAYEFTDFGSSPGPAVTTIPGGAVFLLAAFVALGLPIAVGVIVLTGWLTARRDVSRTAITGISVAAGVAWLVTLFQPSSVTERPAALLLIAPWLVFGLVLRRRPRDIQRR